MAQSILHVGASGGASLACVRQNAHCAPSSSRPVLLLINKDRGCPFGISTMTLTFEIGVNGVSRAVAFSGSHFAGLVVVALGGEGQS